MTKVLLTGLGVVLALAGLSQLLALAFSWIFSKKELKGAFLIIDSDEESLEYQLRSARARGLPAILLDNGMNEESRRIAERFDDVIVCRPEDLASLFEDK